MHTIEPRMSKVDLPPHISNVPLQTLSQTSISRNMSADFWAGYVSGAAGIVIGNPLDLIKTRLQAGKHAHHAEATSTSAPAPQGFRGNFENAGTLVRGEQTQDVILSTKVCTSQD
jgi:hypothetical protein